MLMGPYEPINLLGILVQSVFVENFLLANFLGMCTYLACSNKLKTANNLGIAVVVVLTLAGTLNWIVHNYVTAPGALVWLSPLGIDASKIDLSFLEYLLFIAVIAAFVQVLEMVIEKFSSALHSALGIYLPLITVNCAILGACLFSVTREYPLIPNTVYVFGSGLGWWLAIVLIAAIREKLAYSHVCKGMEGIGITFISSGLMSMAFMGLQGINLRNPSGDVEADAAKETSALVRPFQENLAKADPKK